MQGGIKGKEPMGKIVAVSAKGVRIGEDSPRARYTNAEVDQVFMLRREGYSFSKVAEIMDMPKSTVWAICSGLMRATVPARYKRVA